MKRGLLLTCAGGDYLLLDLQVVSTQTSVNLIDEDNQALEGFLLVSRDQGWEQLECNVVDTVRGSELACRLPLTDFALVLFHSLRHEEFVGHNNDDVVSFRCKLESAEDDDYGLPITGLDVQGDRRYLPPGHDEADETTNQILPVVKRVAGVTKFLDRLRHDLFVKKSLQLLLALFPAHLLF
jgi:hypothetical protein